MEQLRPRPQVRAQECDGTCYVPETWEAVWSTHPQGHEWLLACLYTSQDQGHPEWAVHSGSVD